MRKIKKIENELELLQKSVDNLYREKESLRETLAFVTNHIDTTNLVEIDSLGGGVRYIYNGRLRHVCLGNQNEIIENHNKYVIVRNSCFPFLCNRPRIIYFKIDKVDGSCVDVTDLYLKAQNTATVKTTEPKDEETDGT